MTAGYSGTRLAQQVALKDGLRAWWCGMPENVRAEVELDGPVLQLLDNPDPPIDAAHVFVTERAVLQRHLRQLLPQLSRDGFIWVSWPKKASKVETDITEDTIRELALPLGLVDVKVCAIDAVWSGLKLVIRKELR